ncbi:MAG: hypothetical protein ACK526_06395 [Planctomyces sp.]|jgi:hypothetical protein
MSRIAVALSAASLSIVVICGCGGETAGPIVVENPTLAPGQQPRGHEGDIKKNIELLQVNVKNKEDLDLGKISRGIFWLSEWAPECEHAIPDLEKLVAEPPNDKIKAEAQACIDKIKAAKAGEAK